MVKKILVVGTIVFFGSMVLLVFPRTISNNTVSGLILSSQTWSGTIHVTGSTYFVPFITTLTIKPGTTILFEKKPDVEGTDWIQNADDFIKNHNDPTGKLGYEQSHHILQAKIFAGGTKDSPIIFTSAQTKKEYADWDQLVLLDGSILNYVDLSFAHNGVNINGNGVTIKNSKIHDSLWSCIDIFSTGNLIENNEVYHCWHQAVGLKKVGINTIRNNYIHDAQLSVNCENGAKPEVLNNRFKAAPMTLECGTSINNQEEITTSDTKGGTYNKILIYPSQEN